MTTLIIIGLAILFFALIMVSIALHEVGHLVPAKIFGVKVTQYFVGFGKTLWSHRKGETEYGVKAIPLGGYVKLVGMYPPEKRTGRPKGWLTRMADQARSYEYEDITPADRGKLFHEKPVWQKVIVMFGGPAMNLALAFLLFLGINMVHGTYQSQLTVSAVSDCIIPAGREPAVCLPDDPPTPAREAGVEVGDQIVAFNGLQLDSWDQMSDLIRENRDGVAVLQVRRDGELVVLPQVSTVINHVPNRLDPTKMVEAGFLGVSPTQALTRTGYIGTASQMWELSKMSAVALASFPVRIWNVGVDLVTGQPRDVNSPLSIVGASRFAGELGVADEIPEADRVATFVSLLASVNLFVALLNLVPLLPLDGGHIAGALWEGIRRFLARLSGKPDPGAVDTAKMLPVAYIVGGFLLLGGVVLIVADIFTPIRLF